MPLKLGRARLLRHSLAVTPSHDTTALMSGVVVMISMHFPHLFLCLPHEKVNAEAVARLLREKAGLACTRGNFTFS
jgi:hypothetical protein